MDSQRGRKGRGQKNAWGVPKPGPRQENNSSAKTNHSNQQKKELERADAERRFQAAKAKLESSVQKHLEADSPSSDEDDELQTDNILEKVLQSYTSTGGTDLGRINHFLQEVFQSGAATCLICIGTVKHADAIWSCNKCFCFFHLPCIQRWAADSVAQQKKAAEELTAPFEVAPIIQWGCPKCRTEHLPSDTPQKYQCFCGQRENPPFKEWLVPHSCGETCQKPLQPECGHKCLLLCHPGPCPSCPQVVLSTCHCKKSKPFPKRCSDKFWTCGSMCGATLACGKHQCESLCHPGECEPCPRTSKQFCLCKTTSREQPCASPAWQCEKVCGKILSCGNHNCSDVCHRPGQCGPCPRSGKRTCPCGKSHVQNIPCTQDVPTCGDTCGKTLSCKAHQCLERCHKESCGICLQVSVKSCRCGNHEKEMPCHKEFTCEVKCKRPKNCMRHPCNRKCCDGQCSPCEKICGRQLTCGKHKCAAVCHTGPCYPCPLNDTYSCACGAAKMTLPCGRKKLLKPPKCNLNCKFPSDCHHPTRVPHKCHLGECPPCKQICKLTHPGCKHSCPAPCHSSVWVTTVIDPDRPLEGPWDRREVIKEKKALPCPDCLIPMPVICLGGHEKADWPCFKAIPSCCGRQCGRSLKCGNHLCTLLCHTVKNAPDVLKAGTNCSACESPCQLSRPKGCSHPCLLPCHPAPCKPCQQSIKLKCHCGLNQLLRPCHQWTKVENEGNKEELEKLLNCGNQCPKNYGCGHRCQADCHSGECPNPESCKKRVKVFCPCKRLKKELQCCAVRDGSVSVSCDDTCKERLAKEKEEREREAERVRAEKERKEKEELEKFEKWQQGKKKSGRDKRRRQSEQEEPSWSQRYLKTVVASTLAAIFIGFFINLFQAQA
ncbi:NF-X1-type zinc finger protein NFXL1 [Neocloeon triangulifer]|uniref:NF-X1-type zinc finger protein NFXL1 n=1 Tax=Neocloeon triangulifer TaxID=2078957 RepID=UPI00286F74F2|nr:NF-X1-type zinc finger protein NFXL1 [Neocloeon triangulifer]